MTNFFQEEIMQEGLDKQGIIKGIQSYQPRLRAIGTAVFTRWTEFVKSQ